MQTNKTSLSNDDNDVLIWFVSFNTAIKMIELHASSSLALFKQHVKIIFGLEDEDSQRLEVKTEAGIILDLDKETLLASGALPGEQIIVTLLPPKATETAR
jgi:hypothetical protein